MQVWNMHQIQTGELLSLDNAATLPTKINLYQRQRSFHYENNTSESLINDRRRAEYPDFSNHKTIHKKVYTLKQSFMIPIETVHYNFMRTT